VEEAQQGASGHRAAEKVLEEDHFGLEKVKERIVEYLAVQQRVKNLRGPILCLVGPPGVGKTSLGQSVARSTNRKFVRMSLGGVRDEAEIRGHRRTYIGSMPGKIIQNLAKCGVRNPLFLLDEIDKMSTDFRGDPSSALLEVLDPEQNSTFNDHYLEVDFDLSEVMFVCTANSLNIPAPLLDRMEVIRIPGYTEDEKIEHRAPLPAAEAGEAERSEARRAGGGGHVDQDMMRYYTREAGVRNLERELSKIGRKAVKQLLLKEREDRHRRLEEPRQVPGRAPLPLRQGGGEQPHRPGDGIGVDRGGRRAADHRSRGGAGKGKLTHTGQLGEVMQESIQAAMTVVRSRSAMLGWTWISTRRWTCTFTCPRARPRRTARAPGIGMCTALISALTKIPVRSDVAMTGEITLRGEVLPIGGLKEKLLAAHRGGITTVLIPDENTKDLAEIPDNIKEKLDIKSVKWIDEVLQVALTHMPH
jgi:ATP-dependent Lon protease